MLKASSGRVGSPEVLGEPVIFSLIFKQKKALNFRSRLLLVGVAG
jgi:hypothetical protein